MQDLEWELLIEGFGKLEAPCLDLEGRLCFVDRTAGHLPLTGVPILFVSPWFTTAIAEDADAGDGLLDQMLGHLTDPSFRYRHQWRPNDLVLWDNLAFIHAREPYLESTTRVLWKYEFRFADGIELTPPHGTRLTTG